MSVRCVCFLFNNNESWTFSKKNSVHIFLLRAYNSVNEDVEDCWGRVGWTNRQKKPKWIVENQLNFNLFKIFASSLRLHLIKKLSQNSYLYIYMSHFSYHSRQSNSEAVWCNVKLLSYKTPDFLRSFLWTFHNFFIYLF